MSNDNILQAENAIIGAALETPELWHAILGELSESDLVNNAARQIMHAARMIAADGDVPYCRLRSVRWYRQETTYGLYVYRMRTKRTPSEHRHC